VTAHNVFASTGLKPLDKFRLSFSEQVIPYGIILSKLQAERLVVLPKLEMVNVGSVHVAIEAKACMTEHGKAAPRLHDELNSSHLAIHGSADFAIAVGFVVINFSKQFVSTDRNKTFRLIGEAYVSQHRQPDAGKKIVDKVLEIPRRTQSGIAGFDALGIMAIEMVNDGSRVNILDPQPMVQFDYEAMIRRVASLYAIKFASI